MRTLLSFVVVCVIASGALFYFVTQQQQRAMAKEQQQEQLTTDTSTQIKVKPKKKKRGKRNSVSSDKENTDIANFQPGDIDSLAVHKADRDLLAFKNGELIKKYKVALGLNPVGAKVMEGDNRTPEGWYYIKGKNPFSRYHKSLAVSYPNTEDVTRARSVGKRAGGDIMIHGLMKHMNNKGKDHIKSDWTFGCIAITDEEIDELFKGVTVGTPIFISP